jgi:hypothetical protein
LCVARQRNNGDDDGKDRRSARHVDAVGCNAERWEVLAATQPAWALRHAVASVSAGDVTGFPRAALEAEPRRACVTALLIPTLFICASSLSGWLRKLRNALEQRLQSPRES